MEVVPVVCLRRQGEYAQSLYGEWVLNWQYPFSIYQFINDFNKWFDYNDAVSRLGILGKPLLMSYHHIAGSDLSTAFLSQLGYSLKLNTPNTHLRRSPSDAHIYLKRRLNGHFSNPKTRTVVNEAIRAYLESNLPAFTGPRPKLIWYGAVDCTTLEQCYRLKNHRLCNEQGNDFHDFFPSISYDMGRSISAGDYSSLEKAYREISAFLAPKLASQNPEILRNES